jgi:hypothetical protein
VCNGRRIPPIASAKADTGEDRPNARDLLASVPQACAAFAGAPSNAEPAPSKP